jgi:colanic acid biosynthesis protein WcaH
LHAHEFAAAMAALPLVSVDWVVTNPDGELLLGHRINAPARGWWFTPGGRIRKNEALAQALQRVGLDELGLDVDFCAQLVGQARLMGAWDHFYPDSALGPSASTHYVNLPYWLPLSWAEMALLKLPVGEQHSDWQWLPLVEAAQHLLVHAYVRPYAAWVLEHKGDGALAARDLGL